MFVDGHHHFIMHSSCHHSLLTRFLIRSHTYAWRVWYGGVGGWVGGGGIMTFGTTSGHIVSVDGHHHFIMHSSCHFSRTSSFVPTHTHGGYGTPADVIALAFETLRSLPLFSSSSSSELFPGHYMEDFLPNCIHCWAGMLCESRLKVSRQSRCANSNRYIDGSVVDIYIDTYRKLHFNAYNNACICFNWTVIPNSWTYF